MHVAPEGLDCHPGIRLGVDGPLGGAARNDVQGIGDLNHPGPVKRGVDAVQDHAISGFVSDMHRGLAGRDAQRAITGAVNLTGDIDPPTGEAHLLENDLLAGGVPLAAHRHLNAIDGSKGDAGQADVVLVREVLGPRRGQEICGNGNLGTDHA